MMSVAVSHDPRFYSRHPVSGTLRNPPDYTTSAILIDRKFIAANGPPPPVDPRRLALALPDEADSFQKYIVGVYPDRLVFHPTARGLRLPEIAYDDLIQIDIIYGRDNLLFLLCGKRGIGTYYFFKLTDVLLGERIKNLACRAFPDLNNPQPMPGPKRGFTSQRRVRRRPSPNEHIYESGNTFRSTRFTRERSAPPISSSSSSSPSSSDFGDIYTRPNKNAVQQSSFIRWDGNRPRRNRSQGRPNRQPTAVPRRATSIKYYPQSPSRSRSPSSRRGGNSEVIFIKAQGRGSMRRKPVQKASNKARRPPLVVIDGNQGGHSKPMAKPIFEYRKQKAPPPARKQSKPRKPSPQVKPKTFKLQRVPPPPPPPPSSSYQQTSGIFEYDDSVDSELSFDPTSEAHLRTHRNPQEPIVETVRYGEWESASSWDGLFNEKMPNQPRNVFKNPNAGVPRDEGYGADDITDSSEDSLYLERPQEMGTFIPNRQTNYFPDIQSRFHQVTIK